jgi:hypothetical protein
MSVNIKTSEFEKNKSFMDEVIYLIVNEFKCEGDLRLRLNGHFKTNRIYRAVTNKERNIFALVVEEHVNDPDKLRGYITEKLDFHGENESFSFSELNEKIILERVIEEDLELLNSWMSSNHSDILDKDYANSQQDTLEEDEEDYEDDGSGADNAIVGATMAMIRSEDPDAYGFLVTMASKIAGDIAKDEISFSEVFHVQSKTKEPFVFMMNQMIEMYNKREIDSNTATKLLVQMSLYAINEHRRVWQGNCSYDNK